MGDSFTKLGDIAQMGIQASMDAAQQDLASLRQGRMPQQAMRAGSDAMQAYNNPFGVIMPEIAPIVKTTKTFDPQTGWQVVHDMVAPQMTPLAALLQSNPNSQLLNMLEKARKQSAANTGQ